MMSQIFATHLKSAQKPMIHTNEDNFPDSDPHQSGGEQGGMLQLFSAGSLKFAIFDEAIATITEWRPPTPLPHAPAAVLGVVSIQGRILTVLDPANLLASENGSNPGRFIVALRGDEQLALAVSSKSDEQLAGKALEPQAEGASQGVLGVLKHNEEEIRVLDVGQLFALAIRGRERRRRHF